MLIVYLLAVLLLLALSPLILAAQAIEIAIRELSRRQYWPH